MLVSRANRRLLSNKMLKTRLFRMSAMNTRIKKHFAEVQRRNGKTIVPHLRGGAPNYNIYTGAQARSKVTHTTGKWGYRS
jgi:hypothetical protein